MIRPIASGDLPRLEQIREESGLPPNCMPDVTSKLCVVKLCVEKDDRPVMATCLMITSEVFVLVDHTYGTPEERWQIMQELCERLKEDARRIGLTEFTAWIPTEVEPSFRKRLEDLSFVRSPWSSYTLRLI